ncbi:MAG: hypothetical protein IKV49_02225, partial [Clostridia bacterium]|nr:hypothetical protein [Clostridia bacterium]
QMEVSVVPIFILFKDPAKLQFIEQEFRDGQPVPYKKNLYFVLVGDAFRIPRISEVEIRRFRRQQVIAMPCKLKQYLCAKMKKHSTLF